MRPVNLADIEILARVLVCLPVEAQDNAVIELIRRATIADRYRRETGKRHHNFGSGTLSSAAQNYAKAGRSELYCKNYIPVFRRVINALTQNDTYHQL